MNTIYRDRLPYNIEAPQKLYIQYSHDIDWDYSTGQYPDGTEEDWDWENKYIPISHSINGLEVDKHEWMRIKIGAPNLWTYPIRISANVTNISAISSEIIDEGDTYTEFSIILHFEDGSTVESESIRIRNGEDGIGITSSEIRVDGYLYITYSDGSVVNVGRARGQDAIGLPSMADDDYLLSQSAGVAVWISPFQALGNAITPISPINYDFLTGEISIDSIPLLDGIQYNTSYTPTGSEVIGTTYFDPNNHTISTVLEYGAILQNGLEIYKFGTDEGNNFIEGLAVSVKGVTDNRIAFELTDASSTSTNYHEYIGLLTTEPDSGNRFVVRIGDINSIDTTGGTLSFGGSETWNENDDLYVDPSNPGYLTNVEPVAPNIKICVGKITISHASEGQISLEKHVHPKLIDASDFDKSTLPTSDFDVPMWDTNVWKSSSYYFDLHNRIDGSFRLYGGIITDNGDGTIAISAGVGMVHSTDGAIEGSAENESSFWISPMEEVSWNAIASFGISEGLTDNAYNFIYYDYETQTIKATTNFYSISLHREFTLGRVYKAGTEITARLCGTNAWAFDKRVQLFGEEVFPVVRATGMILGNGSTERTIAVTAGVLWAGLVNRFSVNAFDSSATDTFNYWYRDGIGGWTRVTGQTQIDNANYDDNSGALASLTNNRYGVHWVYEVHDGSIHVVYGRGNYILSQAELAIAPTGLPGIVDAYATIIGKIIVQEGSTTFYSIENPFGTLFQTSSITDHTELSSLNWTSSDHSGTASTFAGFDGSGNATEYDVADYMNNYITQASIDWDAYSPGRAEFISSNTNGPLGSTVVHGLFIPHGTGATNTYGTVIAGRLNTDSTPDEPTLWFRNLESGVWTDWIELLHTSNIDAYLNSNVTYQLEVSLAQLDTDITATTGVAKFPCPEDMTIQSCFIQVDTAPVDSSAIWDINVEGSSIMTDLVIIEDGEYSSLTATTQPSFSDADVDKGEDFVIDCDQEGATTPGQNPILVITYIKR